MSHPIVYLDTSFFIGLLEDEAGRRPAARGVLRYEHREGSKIFTSLLTINEFTVRYYDEHKHTLDCEEKIDQVIAAIRELALVEAITDNIARDAARLMSIWGELRNTAIPKLPRDRNFRWDALHLATANRLHADRVYAFDGPWNDFPKNKVPHIGDIICPAIAPQSSLDFSPSEANE
jgi:predicted nucleic acid-binding protein